MTQIKDLTIDDFRVLVQNIVRETVEETLNEYIQDYDFGAVLKEEVKQRLIESKQKSDAGEKGIPLSEVVKHLKIT